MEKDNLYKKIIYNYRNNIPVCDSEIYVDKNNYLSFEEISYLELKKHNSQIQTDIDIIDEKGIIFPEKENNSFRILKYSFKKLNNFKILNIKNLRNAEVIPKEIFIFELSNDILKLLRFNKSVVFKLILTEYSLRENSYSLYFDNLHIFNIPENSIRSLFNILSGKNNYKEEYVHMSESNTVITKSNNFCNDTFLCIRGSNQVVFEIPELIFLLNCKTISKSFLKIFIDTIFIRQNIGNHLGVKLILLEKINFSSKIIINYLKVFNKKEIEDSVFRFIFSIELLLFKNHGNFENFNFLKKELIKSFELCISDKRLELYKCSHIADRKSFQNIEFLKNDNDWKNICGNILLKNEITQNEELILGGNDIIYFCSSLQIIHSLNPKIKLVLEQNNNVNFNDIDIRCLPAICSMMNKEIDEKFLTKDMFLNNFMKLIQFRKVMFGSITKCINKGFSPIKNLDILVETFFGDNSSIIDSKSIPFNEIEENYYLITDHLKLFLLYLIQKSDICENKHIDLVIRLRKDILWNISYE